VSGQPDWSGDPYRTLGLEPGAPMGEVKRAYRRLAKAFHPDSAGEAALPRFLAIHAAYEQLITGRILPGSANAPTPPRPEPWRADPERARASRERASRERASKGRASREPAGATRGPRPAAGDRARAGEGRAGPAGSSTEAGGNGGSTASGKSSTRGDSGGARRSGTSGSGRRSTRKATLGSTTYDDARDHADATWSGASWYGPSTGEYWIINPREYADPRKHGPEYLSRARRRAERDAQGAEVGPDEGPLDTAAATAAEASARWATTGGSATAGAATAGAATAGRHTTERMGRADPAGAAWAETDLRGTRRPGAPRSSGATETSRGAPPSGEVRWQPGPSFRGGPRADAMRASRSPNRSWFGAAADDPIRRLGLALVAWPPLGIATAAAIGEVTGCSTYSAACDGSEPLLPWLAQAVLLGLLLLLPPVARLLSIGTVAILLALVPVTALLIALGARGQPEVGLALGALLAGAWLIGVGYAALGTRRLNRADQGSSG
jgi:hypothetical protein